jgi:hypothetical protein
MLFRDPSAWYHIVWVWDTTEAAAADRSIVYVNGVKQAIRSATLISPDEDALSEINSVAPHYLGQQGDSSQYLSSYLADAYFIDGTAYAASSFGELDSDTNQWKPKDASDLTFGTNGFYLKFQDSAALGDDSSGNTNDFAVTNLVATDQMVDTPTNNFATLNPLPPYGTGSTSTSSAVTFTEGNLRVKTPTVGGGWSGASTISVSEGKWYAEMY